MPFGTKIQTYDGAHATHDSAKLSCAVDWANARLWMGATVTALDYIAKYGISSGAEQDWSDVNSINPGAGIDCVGWDGSGRIYLSGPNQLTHGSLSQIDGTSFALLANPQYSAPFFGGTNIVSNGGGDTIADTNIGNNVINLNNTSYSSGGSYLTSYGWPNSNHRSTICPGSTGSGVSYLLTSPGGGIDPQICTLAEIDASGANSTVGTVVPTDIDAGWTEIYARSSCVDQTDGNIIVNFSGIGGATNNYIAKLSTSSGAVLWKTALTTTSPEAFGGSQWAQSRIFSPQIAFLQNSPTLTIVVMNTATGAITSTQTTGLTGVTAYGQQSYDSVSGAIIGMFSWNGDPAGPLALNSSAAPFTGWAALYVTEPIIPTSPGRKFAGFIGLSRVRRPVDGPTERITEEGDQRITESSDDRILE